MVLQCNICGNTKDNSILRVREMMYGTREMFDYLSCPYCNTLQLHTPVSDISRYYPENYVSFTTRPGDEIYKGLKGRLHKMRDAYPVVHEGLLGKFLYKLKPSLQYSIYDYLKIKKGHSILDVGAGNGFRLHNLNQIGGLTDLTGIDPHIGNDIYCDNGVKVLKKDIFEVEGQWDIILFQHSFEHMEEPLKVMKKACSLLKRGGICMLFMPVCDTYAFRHYKENWVQLDAPRHFYIYSVKSSRLLGEMSGLHLEHYCFNSTSFQFVGSELYKKDIPLSDMDSRHFSKKELYAFEKKAVKLNKEEQGDQAAFYFRKPY